MVYYYKDTAYYAMACKEKELERHNISHFLQWNAMLFLKQSGIRYYELGTQDFGDQLHKHVSEKDMSISKFKRGFGGFLITGYIGEKFYTKKSFIECYNKRVDQYAEEHFK